MRSRIDLSGLDHWTGIISNPDREEEACRGAVDAESAPLRECRGTSSLSDLGIDPEPTVIPELGGSLPPTGLRLPLPCLTPTFGPLRRLPDAKQVVEAFRSTNKG